MILGKEIPNNHVQMQEVVIHPKQPLVTEHNRWITFLSYNLISSFAFAQKFLASIFNKILTDARSVKQVPPPTLPPPPPPHPSKTSGGGEGGSHALVSSSKRGGEKGATSEAVSWPDAWHLIYGRMRRTEKPLAGNQCARTRRSTWPDKSAENAPIGALILRLTYTCKMICKIAKFCYFKVSV